VESIKLIVLALAALTSFGCMVLLFRGYARTGARMLFWSALCFVFLSLNNLLLFVDIIVFPTEMDLRLYRGLAALAGIACLLYAFIWEAD
jgi:hypothetical protein